MTAYRICYVSHTYCATRRLVKILPGQDSPSFSTLLWLTLSSYPPPVSPAFCSSTSASFSPLTTSPFSASHRLDHSHFTELPMYSLTFSFSNKLELLPEHFAPLNYPAPLGNSVLFCTSII